jgi:hypothetical protein
VKEVVGAEVLTVKVAAALTVPDVLVMVVTPGASAVARPFAFTVATDGLEDVHVADFVMSVMVPSE